MPGSPAPWLSHVDAHFGIPFNAQLFFVAADIALSCPLPHQQRRLQQYARRVTINNVAYLVPIVTQHAQQPTKHAPRSEPSQPTIVHPGLGFYLDYCVLLLWRGIASHQYQLEHHYHRSQPSERLARGLYDLLGSPGREGTCHKGDTRSLSYTGIS
ncbi:hypothetical protein DL546_005065 [Coniochaeta pulveracea]|uniref:Uncharacterized protein n=1 Tax=Coniochaeta pulveracea TaxID=177199 RepID=A0A420Y1N4_9PEZI|nr:hypothetical protein DL546_005065 [Coniochaeta pulveracea]